MQAQHSLQKFILGLTRPLGIIGVLPAFQGNMPPQIKTLKPAANISTTHDPEQGTEGNCAWVSGTDPLFDAVADTWMKIMIEDFGTDHWYQCDGFFTGMAPPWYDATNPLSAVTAQQSYGVDLAPDGGPPVDPETIKADPAWTQVWKGAF